MTGGTAAIRRTLGRLLFVLKPSPIPDLRFEVRRRREMRRFLSALLVVQMGYAATGAITGGPGALSHDRTTAFWLGTAFFGVSAGLFFLIRRVRNIDRIEALGLAAGSLSIATCLLGQLLDPQTAVAVTLYEAIAIGVVPFAVPWRVVSHVAWVGLTTTLAVAGLLLRDPAGPARDAIFGALVFAVLVSLLGKLTTWNRRVERRLQQAEVRGLNVRLRAAARTDWGTGVGNRLALDEHLNRIATRGAGCHGFALIDVDHFKGVNDAFGHLAGDAVLRRVVDQIQASIRVADRVFRYGGEEFLVVFDRLEPGSAAMAAERIRAGVESIGLPNPAAAAGLLTVSVGTSEVMLDLDPDSLTEAIAAADANLYVAKRAGRNLVRSGSPDSPATAASRSSLLPIPSAIPTEAEGNPRRAAAS